MVYPNHLPMIRVEKFLPFFIHSPATLLKRFEESQMKMAFCRPFALPKKSFAEQSLGQHQIFVLLNGSSKEPGILVGLRFCTVRRVRNGTRARVNRVLN